MRHNSRHNGRYHRQVEVRTAAVEPDVSTLSVAEVLTRLNTNIDGLSEQSAAERLQRHGRNSISVDEPIAVGSLLRENFLHTMALLLWAAGLIGFLAQMPQLGVAIWLVNIINGAFSFWQEFRAQKTTLALKQLLPLSVQVRREGKVRTISAYELVPGDVVIVNEGDKISADARVIEDESLTVDQSTLTGETTRLVKTAELFSKRLAKDANLIRADLPNLLFAGTSCLSGHGLAVVYATGTHTEFGRIARLTATIAEQPSPLQREMERVTKIVSMLAVSIGALMFVIAITMAHVQPEAAFIFAMGMVVAFVPEGMVPTITLALALAVQRMVKRNALVKRLSSVESLGCTNVICTDKTGTLTENRMTVARVLSAGKDYLFTGHGYELNGKLCSSDNEPVETLPAELVALLQVGLLCNNATLVQSADALSTAGDPTELALLVAAGKAGLFQSDAAVTSKRLHENAFDSHRKRMSTIYEVKDALTPDSVERFAFIKGSPASVLEHCRDWLSPLGLQAIDEGQRRIILREIDGYAGQGLRVIAAARKSLQPDSSFDIASVECDLTFLGLFAMLDPPRPEVLSAVAKCRQAGIQVVMITGDYEVTAEAIARKVGIVDSGAARVITGAQLDRMTNQELVELLTSDVVFARVSPEHKLRVVEAFQRTGQIVAVTGDGVNDAPALKKADIGVAMGLCGTDVAREAADIILLDDNFASIVNAVEEGRAVYDNIKKFAVYVFNSNMAEAVPFVLMLLSCGLIPMPLTVMQVLSVDLGTDMVPAIGLGADTAQSGVMQRKPRSRKEPLLSRMLLAKALLWYGAIESLLSISGYFYINFLHGWPSQPLAPQGSEIWKTATTMTLTCIVTSQIGAVFCCRTQTESVFSISPFSNRLILAGVAFEIALLAALMYVPALRAFFDTAPLPPQAILYALTCIPVIILLDEARKLFLRRKLSSGVGA